MEENIKHLHIQKQSHNISIFKDVPDNVTHISNFEARKYVAGFVARKLGLRPRNKQSTYSWISFKGKGKLYEPSNDLINICDICDIKFDIFHKDGLNKCKKPFELLFSEIMTENPGFPANVVKLYCKVKVFARIRLLNRDIKLKKLNKSVRMFKQTAQFMN